MAKVQLKSEKLTPFGGIFAIMEQFDSMLSPIIDQTLGQDVYKRQPHYNKSTSITKKQNRKYNISTSPINILL